MKRFVGLVAVGLASGVACSKSDAPPIDVSIGPPVEARETFRPERAFAEYIELPGHRNELRLTLASYDASCDRFVPPGPDHTVVSIVVATPPGPPPEPGVYAWAGIDAVGSERRPAHRYARPSVRLGSRTHHPEPGGSVELTEIRLGAPDPRIVGVLGFEFPGDAEHPASSVRGRFRASICGTGR